MDSSLMKRLFTPVCLAALFVVLLAVWQDRDRDWKQYQETYYRLAASRSSDPAQREQILEIPLEIKQIQTEVGGRVDRCVTCHLGVDNPNLADAQQPYTTHPKLESFRKMLDHSLDDFGCTFCHDGQGLATARQAAHGRVSHWDRPLLTDHWLEIACGRCHKGTIDLTGAPILSKGRRLVKRVGCNNCHKMEGFEEEEQGEFGPALQGIGLKIREQWLRDWLKDPYSFEARTKMLKFYLSDEEAAAISTFLMTMKEDGPAQVDGQTGDPRVAKGRELFGELRCFFCHKMEGFEKKETAPDLTGFGMKNAMDLDFGNVRDTEYTLKGWTMRKIRDPRAFATKEAELTMPGNDLKEDQITALTVLLLSFTGEEVPKAYRRTETYGDDEGKRLFEELNCIGCHNARAQGIVGASDENVAKDLSNTGSKTKVAWMFQWLKDPSSIYQDTRMPTIGSLDETRALHLTGYVMSFREDGQKHEEIEGRQETISPVDIIKGRKLYETMECYRCHRIAGKGGEIAPELSRIGEKVREDWLVQWLAKPENYNLNMLDDRPIILSDEQVRVLAGYLLSLKGVPPLYPPRVPQDALLIKEQEVKEEEPLERGRTLFGEAGPVQYLFGKRVGKMGLGCYGCHCLGDQGNDIGPDLSEEGQKLKGDWLVRWLKDPQAYMPDSKMGDFHLADEDARALAGYLMTHRSHPASEEVVAYPKTYSASRGSYDTGRVLR
jgi:mono/diheme cytochrome c family protein